jgi:hypothetical protein
MRSEIAPELLRQLLRYEAETGLLFWNARKPELFSDTDRRSRTQNAVWWNGRFAGKRACKPDAHKGYLRVCIFGIEYPAHRVIWAMETGAWPTETIDHANGDKAHNRFANLREATVSENNRNRANYGKSKFRGVSWRSRQSCWISAIKTDGRVTFLGSFDNEEDAARAYDRAAVIQHGEFARTNFSQADYEQRILSALSVPSQFLPQRHVTISDEQIRDIMNSGDASTVRIKIARLIHNETRSADHAARLASLPTDDRKEKGNG